MAPDSHPPKVLAVINKRFPRIWQSVDKVRAEYMADPTWPEHIFMPTYKWWEIVKKEMPQGEHERYVYNLSALGAWRVTQDIVSFDPDFYRELVNTDNVVGMKLHKEILYRLPAWCIYFLMPEEGIAAYGIRGFFAYWDYENGNDLFKFSFVRTNHAMHSVTLDFKNKDTLSFKFEDIKSEHRDVIPPALNIVLYVCAYGLPTRHKGSGGGSAGHPSPKKVKGGWRFFPPPHPVNHLLGQELGESIRKASAGTGQRETAPAGPGTHASPRPHIRRAHWHGYWFGSLKEREGKEMVPRRFELRWIPPLPVALKDDDA